jgi:hypothetical protein
MGKYNIGFGRFSAAFIQNRQPNFHGQSFFLYGRFCVILQNFRPAGISGWNVWQAFLGGDFNKSKCVGVGLV